MFVCMCVKYTTIFFVDKIRASALVAAWLNLYECECVACFLLDYLGCFGFYLFRWFDDVVKYEENRFIFFDVKRICRMLNKKMGLTKGSGFV